MSILTDVQMSFLKSSQRPRKRKIRKYGKDSLPVWTCDMAAPVGCKEKGSSQKVNQQLPRLFKRLLYARLESLKLFGTNITMYVRIASSDTLTICFRLM
jgi:hypothetical protein